MLIGRSGPTERVVLVDETDRALGTAEKLTAHREGWLHRAVSVFVMSHSGDVLLQRRSSLKYHSGGLWANACCGHPLPDESPEAAAHRRLREEMGMVCALRPMGSFLYRVPVTAGLVEYEFDHVFFGLSDDDPLPDRREVDAWRRVSVSALHAELAQAPERFAAWFHLAWLHVAQRRSDTSGAQTDGDVAEDTRCP
jgi:isopentenyl-diphosphate Delta-isomerase